MPNFLIIGAGKSATTSLYYYLKQHPQIFTSPRKEPRFFAFEGEKLSFGDPSSSTVNCVTDLEVYRSLFKQVSNEIAIGEASTWYLSSYKAPKRIYHHIPNVKLIAILRDPVERAYSHFLHLLRDKVEPITDFKQAMSAEDIRIQNNWSPHWHYKQQGFYYLHLQRYFDLFERDQIRVYLYEDFINNPLEVLQDIFHFLDVEETFIPNMSIKYNTSGLPKSKNLHQFLMKRFWRNKQSRTTLDRFLSLNFNQYIQAKIIQLNLNQKPQLSPKLRVSFIEEYREDILKLQDLIKRDLSSWLVTN
ncbi:sulfotransferase family protein [Acaryochloris marina NIES-2412]|uniref:sulfotransferase family protein n=1 Tax=Acaryochloris marina TaxID=155978 RepID=UPI004057E25A